jgi:hypothetical protein
VLPLDRLVLFEESSFSRMLCTVKERLTLKSWLLDAEKPIFRAEKVIFQRKRRLFSRKDVFSAEKVTFQSKG